MNGMKFQSVSAVLDDVITDAQLVPLSQAVEVNPKIDRTALHDDLDVSFVPMAAVEALSGGIDVSTVRKYAEVKKGYTHFRDGDILFAKVTPCMENGKMAIARKLVNGVGFGSTEFHVLRPRAGVDARYIYYFVSSQTFRKEASGHMTGAVGLRRVPSAYLEEQLIPLPGIEQQREIVAELEKQFSRLDEAVANLKRVKANLKRYKASVLKDAVEGRLVSTEAELARRGGRSFETGEQLLQRILETRRSEWKGKGKYKERLDSSTASLSSVPEGWVAATTGQLCDCIVPSRDKPKSFSGVTPWLTLPDFEEDKILISSSRVGLGLSESEIAGSKAKVVPQGSVVMSCVGRFGITAVLGEDAVINQQLHAFLPNAMVMPKYLAYALRTRVNEMNTVSTATTIAYLNKENCNNVRIALPPMAEQFRIVAEVEARLSVAVGTEAASHVALGKAKALTQVILKTAFSSSNLNQG